MMKKILSMFACGLFTLGMVACGTQPKEKTYESVVEEYSSKMESRITELIEESKSEINISELSLDEISEDAEGWITEIGDIYGEGLYELAEVYRKNDDDDFETADNYKKQLEEVFNGCSDDVVDYIYEIGEEMIQNIGNQE